MESLIEREAAIRLQPWRKIILPGDRPETYGVLMCALCLGTSDLTGLQQTAAYRSSLVTDAPSTVDLVMKLGGETMMVFCR
jgi:hypothetical protein